MATATPPSIEAYTLLRTALTLFKKTPAELAPLELRQVTRQARNEYDLETRVLASLEAASVIIPPQELERAFETVKERFDSEQAFKQSLDAQGLTVTQLRAALSRQCKVDAVLEKVSARAPQISEVEIGIFYHTHKAQFHLPERRLARHILISINPDYPENTRDNSWQRIQMLAETLKRKPYKFAELALRYSECPTALNKGHLGEIVPGKLYPELDAALFKLKPFVVSEVVETEVGFHLIQCTKVWPAETLSLEKATPKIRNLMQTRAKRVCQKAWLASLPTE